MSGAVPTDYRLLVPRDWFRVDLTSEGWRPHLKTYVDLHTTGKSVRESLKREIWIALRNSAEAGLAHGALEFYLRSESDDDGMAMPASLLVSLIPVRDPASTSAQDLLASLAEKEGEAAEVSIVEFPAGEAVRVAGPTTLDMHVQVPGGGGYLSLSFSAPMSGMAGPMGRLCEAIARSLRWVM